MPLFSFPAQVNERAARTVALVVALSLLGTLVLQQRWPIPVLCLGFFLRVGWGPRFSPLARAAMFSASRLWTVRPVAGPPKRFAQGIGAACTLAASVLLFSGHSAAGWSMAGVVVFFALLEASLSFCMGCWIYARLQAVGLVPPDACMECATLRR